MKTRRENNIVEFIDLSRLNKCSYTAHDLHIDFNAHTRNIN